MPERWEIVQSVTAEENLVARVYPKSIEVYPRRMKKLMSGFLCGGWLSPLSIPGPTPGLV